MLWSWLAISLAAIVVLLPIVFFAMWLRTARQDAYFRRAREEFYLRREWQEAYFLKVAAESRRPRGLSWGDCDFADEVSFARDRTTGQLRALVAVTIGFAAVEGGGMEDVKAVGNLRAATAVFRYENGHWQTDGRAVFDLNPLETIHHFRHELEMVE